MMTDDDDSRSVFLIKSLHSLLDLGVGVVSNLISKCNLRR